MRSEFLWTAVSACGCVEGNTSRGFEPFCDGARMALASSHLGAFRSFNCPCALHWRDLQHVQTSALRAFT
ncbi:hypothetical protein BC830DRAFT_1225353 [Chytriomyces sp. MP71]|nr:hypothetical protein BC830DRAFT_1225353 [Chytriomyces sp. MP71]